MKLPAKNILHVYSEGSQEAHNEGPKAHPAVSHRWDLN